MRGDHHRGNQLGGHQESVQIGSPPGENTEVEKMKALVCVLVTLAALSVAPSAEQKPLQPQRLPHPGRTGWFWHDDLEPPDPGWTHGDFTATTVPHFHIDTYMAFSGSHSWWCGTFEFDANGGYGNNWRDVLELPPVDWTGYDYPWISFYYRLDMSDCVGPGTGDWVYVETQSGGDYAPLNEGYTGTSPWQQAMFYIGHGDNPAVCRFRVESDCYSSDEHGRDSEGGAFMCDEIKIFDYLSGDVLFYDDAEGGGLCTPVGPPVGGDYWHTISSNCKAWSDPTVWVNTMIDTPGYVPPNVRNWLMTPVVDISSATSCTVCCMTQYFTESGGYATKEVTLDGGATWIILEWMRDEGGLCWDEDQCASCGPCEHLCDMFQANCHVLDDLLPATGLAMRWAYYSGDDGVGPDECGCAGITVDDVWFWGDSATAVEQTSWARMKALYR
jgi:hypothetical protein